MQIGQHIRQLGHHPRQRLLRDPPAAGRKLLEGSTLDIIHDGKDFPVPDQKIIDVRDIGMPQVLEDIRLRPQRLQVAEPALHALDDDILAEIPMVRQKDQAGSSPPDLFHYLVCPV